MTERQKKNIFELTRTTEADYLRARKMPLRVMADSVRSMMNVGSLFRTADAFMVEELILAGITGSPPNAEISKTALGAERSVAWRHVDDALAEAERLRAQGWKIYVLEQTHGSTPLQEFIPERGEKYVLVAGNEVEGVSQSIVDMADGALEIPQRGTKHSLNVSVSAGIAMWQFFASLELE